MKLVCVVFKEESPVQFTDTVELFDYGFQNFQILNISENEEKYNIDNVNFFQSDNDIFGSSKPILSIDTDSYVIVPNMADFSNLDSTIDYNAIGENHVAQINYTYNGTYVGSAYVNLAKDTTTTYQFNANSSEGSETSTNTTIVVNETNNIEKSSEEDTIFINVKKVLIAILILAVIVICLFIIRAFIINNNYSRRRKNHMKRKKHRRERIRSNFDDFDF